MSERTIDFVETPVAPPEWDVGVYEIWDDNGVVALLWVVTNNNNKYDATEYWGLGPGWVWPSAAATSLSYQFKHSTAYTITNTTQFKAKCDALFGTNKTDYQKHTVVTF